MSEDKVDEAQVETKAEEVKDVKKAQLEPIMLVSPKATVNWLDADGKVVETCDVCRSIPSIINYLSEAIIKDEKKADINVEIFLKLATDGKKAGGTEIHTLANGKAGKIVEILMTKEITPMRAISQLQIMVTQLADLSALKSVIITAVFADAQAGGFGFVSDSSEVTDKDVMVAGTAAANQAEMYKEEMRKRRGIKYAEDNPIIMPGQVKPGLTIIK